MSTDKTPEDQITEAGAAELEDGELDKAAGGAVGVIAVSHEVKNATFGDGSVRFLKDTIN